MTKGFHVYYCASSPMDVSYLFLWDFDLWKVWDQNEFVNALKAS